jgi:ribonuclease HI
MFASELHCFGFYSFNFEPPCGGRHMICVCLNRNVTREYIGLDDACKGKNEENSDYSDCRTARAEIGAENCNLGRVSVKTPSYMTDEVFRIEFDGGARGNPGAAGFGVVIRAADGTPIVTVGKFIGNATNNVAEYSGLIEGLRRAIELKLRRVEVFGDSELVVKQMNGQYKVRNAGLKPLFEQAQTLAREFEKVSFAHVRREQNAHADKLYNRAIDKRREVSDDE